MNTIGERIKEARNKAGLTQVELAEKMNISKQLLCRYETGKITNIPSDKIEMIAEICHTDPWLIFGWQPKNKAVNHDDNEFLAKYKMLDDIDKGRILEKIDSLLSDSKYKKDIPGCEVG